MFSVQEHDITYGGLDNETSFDTLEDAINFIGDKIREGTNEDSLTLYKKIPFNIQVIVTPFDTN